MAKFFSIDKHFEAVPTESDFKLVERPLPTIQDGEILIETLYASVDPYMRVHLVKPNPDAPMIGTGVGKVIESKNADYPVNTLVAGGFGWSTHTVGNASVMKGMFFRKFNSKHCPSYGLGILGLTGFTAYFGLLKICNPQPGETVFVNAAAGATGSAVGQIAKIKGCRVVGCAGSDAKVQYLKEIGFDAAFNYKTVENLGGTLKELCPKGIDCFFENVGGSMFDVVLDQMNRLGRVALCGAISTYNNNNRSSTKGPYVHFNSIFKELKLQGFLVGTFQQEFDTAEKELNQWLDEGKIKVREHVVDGFENMPKAFISLFSGSNIGKVVVKM